MLLVFINGEFLNGWKTGWLKDCYVKYFFGDAEMVWKQEFWIFSNLNELKCEIWETHVR